MAERVLSMHEVRGSMPLSSNYIFFLFVTVRQPKDRSTRQLQFALIFNVKGVNVPKLRPMAQETF